MKFREMSISDKTLDALDEVGYLEPTEIQEKVIPLILQGKEVVARSQTGTGKTAAFGIGLIEIISRDKNRKALVLVPTRELALQLTKEIRSIAKTRKMEIYAIYGGQHMDTQISLLRKGFDIVIATPGRLLDHARRRTIDLSKMNCVVLDEADRMLDMGFKEDIDSILDQVSKQRQIMLFSATIDDTIKAICRSYMRLPEFIEVGAEGKVELIDEEFIELPRREKMKKLKEILAREPMSRIIIFVATKRAAEYVCHKLNVDGINARYLHGGKTQNQRERTMHEFKEGRFNIMIATDVAARGLHIEEVSHIINYDKAGSDDTHTHRIGRTGRMGKKGKAITFVDTDVGDFNRRGEGYKPRPPIYDSSQGSYHRGPGRHSGPPRYSGDRGHTRGHTGEDIGNSGRPGRHYEHRSRPSGYHHGSGHRSSYSRSRPRRTYHE